MHRRLFCSSRATATVDSIRQSFMKIKPDRQILDHLDNLGLGYAAKRRSRKAIATKYEKELPGVQSVVRSAENAVRSRRKTKGETGKKIINASPYPFNKGPRKIQNIVTARQWGEVSALPRLRLTVPIYLHGLSCSVLLRLWLPSEEPCLSLLVLSLKVARVLLCEQVPDFGPVPEVAVIGRSNVGKSTLLNAILGYTSSHVQKAAVSNKPGETTALQFFTLGKHITTKQPTLVVTDMPGYGFAFMKPEEAKRCFHLVSSRRQWLIMTRLDGVVLVLCCSVSACLAVFRVFVVARQAAEAGTAVDRRPPRLQAG